MRLHLRERSLAAILVVFSLDFFLRVSVKRFSISYPSDVCQRLSFHVTR